MRLALDYDGTYTRDPDMWEAFIDMARKAGHSVTCVTMRYPTEPVRIGCEVVYTSRKAKSECFDADVWIDDMPHFILVGGA